MNRRQALMNALAAVSYQKTEAVNQQRLARGNDDLVAFWQQEADEAEQTYRELLAMLGEHHEPQASPANSPDHTGTTGEHYKNVAGASDAQGQQEVETLSPVCYQGAASVPQGNSGGAARTAEVAAGAVSIATSKSIDAAGRTGCFHNSEGCL